MITRQQPPSTTNSFYTGNPDTPETAQPVRDGFFKLPTLPSLHTRIDTANPFKGPNHKAFDCEPVQTVADPYGLIDFADSDLGFCCLDAAINKQHSDITFEPCMESQTPFIELSYDASAANQRDAVDTEYSA